MEPDEDVSEHLKMQFKALQEQQQKRMQNLMEKKKDSQHSLKQNNKENQDEGFGIPDALNLSFLATEMSEADVGKKLLENENEQLQQQLRELVDENGRLYKLLKEKDFEIKQLHKKIEEERLALMGTSGLSGDVAAAKIVELAKQNRHITAEMEREKTKAKQLNNRIKQLEKELQMSTVKLQSHGDNLASRKKTDAPMSPEMKALQEKLSAANLKVSEYRNQLQATKQELKMTYKLIANEVGEDINVQGLLSTPGSWRGRAQQILVLQGKVRELETQLNRSKSRLSDNDANEEPLSFADSRKSSVQAKNQLRIRSLEREKKEALEKLMNQHQVLQKDHEDVKKKLDGSKARNKVLSSEVKTLKEQISTLLDKGKHDDELVDALLSQQKEMQIILKNLSQQEERNVECHQTLGKQLNVEVQKQSCLIEQLKQMVADREVQVKQLEEIVRQLKLQQQQQQHSQPEESGSDSVSTLSTESLEEENCPFASKREDYMGSNNFARTVSKMGHTLVDSAATLFPSVPSPGRASEPNELNIGTLKMQITEYKTLCQAAEVERDRLIELVSMLQKRVDESITKVWEAEKKFQEQQRKYVALEQQFAKLKMETGKPGGASKAYSKNKAGLVSTAQPPSSTRMSWNAGDKKDLPSMQLSEVPLESQLEELSTQLAIQVDENEGLKNALQDTVRIKEEDFRVYQDTVGQEGVRNTADLGPVEEAGGAVAGSPQLEKPRGQLFSSILMYTWPSLMDL
ncbi:coiled-coil domain-containing protein 13 isoform X1 [Python bivittatus]|uniref:Coiled-coil domain-containing protein 13 isoform X1 n=1 Tax=Python bivittatus TaxID=176946 RepID=A0A9F3QSK7_PYTBI|nr:coiled-coil domain-containing protein 13 isoform X1 [Python bivittatus]XP_015744113.1 coiled-coil domain-containing protein 13 isoform X1 [Python bivittatus]